MFSIWYAELRFKWEIVHDFQLSHSIFSRNSLWFYPAAYLVSIVHDYPAAYLVHHDFQLSHIVFSRSSSLFYPTAYLVDLPASSIIPADLTKSVNPIKMWTDRLALQIADLEVQLLIGVLCCILYASETSILVSSLYRAQKKLVGNICRNIRIKWVISAEYDTALGS